MQFEVQWNLKIWKLQNCPIISVPYLLLLFKVLLYEYNALFRSLSRAVFQNTYINTYYKFKYIIYINSIKLSLDIFLLLEFTIPWGTKWTAAIQQELFAFLYKKKKKNTVKKKLNEWAKNLAWFCGFYFYHRIYRFLLDLGIYIVYIKKVARFIPKIKMLMWWKFPNRK